MAIAGLILGIVSIILGCFGGWFSIIALPLAIVGLVLSVVGGKQLKAAGKSAGVATAGLVIGIIAVIITAIFFFVCGVCVLCFADAINDAANELNNMNRYY